MDKSWMLKDRRSKDYEEGVESFLNFAIMCGQDPRSIRCPCRLCGNLRKQSIKEIKNHLFFNGIDQSYQTWVWHGEVATTTPSPCVNPPKFFHEGIETPPLNVTSDVREMVEAAYNECAADPAKSANLERKFLFVNPSAISGTTKQLVVGSKSALLASLLNNAENDQLVFIPHVLGFHWVLFAIDLSYLVVYYLDSLRGSVHQDLKLILSTAIKLRDNAKNLKRILAWKEVECPMQPTSVECGYYVMRFMKELIADRNILSRRDFKWKETYTQAEIDEVRVEWMNFILELDI